MEIKTGILEIIFPKEVFKWFDLTDGTNGENTVNFIFVEKDLPPLTAEDKDKSIIAKKFHNITITDFSIRGKQTKLTFRRRYWKLQGQKDYLKNDIKLSFPGTLLEQKFADFLKAGSGD
jgi:hypothetical protein